MKYVEGVGFFRRDCFFTKKSNVASFTKAKSNLTTEQHELSHITLKVR